jgi:hypothetical protein
LSPAGAIITATYINTMITFLRTLLDAGANGASGPSVLSDLRCDAEEPRPGHRTCGALLAIW